MKHLFCKRVQKRDTFHNCYGNQGLAASSFFFALQYEGGVNAKENYQSASRSIHTNAAICPK
jgi:hypothetical protein